MVKFFGIVLGHQSLMRRPAMTHETMQISLSVKRCGGSICYTHPMKLFLKMGWGCCFFMPLKYREAGTIWNFRCLHITNQMHVHIAACPHTPNVMSLSYKMGGYLCETQPAPASDSHRNTLLENLTRWLK